MAARARWLSLAVVAALVLPACQPNRFVTGWVPFWDAADGRTIIADDGAASLYSEVSLMWHEADDLGDGTIDLLASASSLAATVAEIRAQGLPVIPAIIDGNDSSDKGRMLALLADPTKRNAHVEAIVTLVTANGYDGIDIDYEAFPWLDGISKYHPTHTPNWIAFVQRLGTRLHSKGKVLSVTVPASWYGGSSCWAPSATGSLECGYTFYAQQQIAPYVDRLRLMVYDWSVSSPGPVAPIAWVNSTIAYSDSRVPNSRLQLGVPTYGRWWTTQYDPDELCPDGVVRTRSVTMQASADLFADVFAATGKQPVRDASGELKLMWTEVVTGPRTTPITPPEYPPPPTTIDRIVDDAGGDGLEPALRLGVPPPIVTCTVQHTAYLPDPTSVAQRAQAAVGAGWSGIAMWAIGYETADMYAELAGIPSQRPGGAPTGALDPVVAGSKSLRVTGFAYHPEFDLPVAVRVTVTPSAGGTTVSRTVTARESRVGMPSGLGPYHGLDTSFTVAAGAYDVCATMVLWGGVAGPSLGCRSVTALP